MKSNLWINALAAMAIFAATQASALTITPSSPGVIPANLGPSNCEPDCVYDAFDLTNDGSLELLYKSDVGPSNGIGTDSGLFASSYQTTFSNSATDPEDALIEYLSGAAISCPTCYLAIKDGNQNPSYYFYDLSAWNGTESITLDGFWTGRGAISHVSIWGSGHSVPEPGTLALLGLGLLGVSFARRRRA